MSTLKIIILVIFCSLAALGVGYLLKARLSKAQVKALIEIEVSERQDAKREQILSDLQKQIIANEKLLNGEEETKQTLSEAQDALLIAKNKLADTIKAEAKDDKIIIALKDENAALYNTLDKANAVMAKQTEVIENNTEELKKARSIIKEDQEEIAGLRDSLKDLVVVSDKNKMFAVGIGATMPIGVEIIFTVKIPKIPFGLFSSAALTTGEPINYVLAAGVILTF